MNAFGTDKKISQEQIDLVVEVNRQIVEVAGEAFLADENIEVRNQYGGNLELFVRDCAVIAISSTIHATAKAKGIDGVLARKAAHDVSFQIQELVAHKTFEDQE